MQQHSTNEEHDESYFASFTDMLVGIIFIFIILLMIVANNFQQATEQVVKQEAELASRNEAIELDIKKKAAEAEITKAAAILAMQKEAAELEIKKEATILAMQKEAAALAEQKQVAADVAVKIQQERDKASYKSDDKAGEKNGAGDKIGDKDILKKEQQVFTEARNKVLRAIEQELKHNNVPVNVNFKEGALLLPEDNLFDNDQPNVSNRGLQTLKLVASALDTYLPCIAGTADQYRLRACSNLNLDSDNGLESLFIEDHTSSTGASEHKWLLSAERGVSIFKELTYYESYLDQGLKNISGSPILNVRGVKALRAAALKNGQKNGSKSIELKLIMRSPNAEDIKRRKIALGQ